MAGRAAGQARGARKAEDTESGGIWNAGCRTPRGWQAVWDAGEADGLVSFRKTERSVQVPPVDASSASLHTILVLLISVHTLFLCLYKEES